MLTHPWDQLPKEASKAFQAFIPYRDLGPRRSCVAAAKQIGISHNSARELSQRHNWQERVRAWDQYIDKQSQHNQIEAVKKMKKRQIALAIKAQKAAEKGLKRFIAQFADDEEQKVSPYATKPDGLSKLLDTGCRLERLNRDEPEQNIELSQNTKLDGLNMEELEVYRNLLAKIEGNL